MCSAVIYRLPARQRRERNTKREEPASRREAPTRLMECFEGDERRLIEAALRARRGEE